MGRRPKAPRQRIQVTVRKDLLKALDSVLKEQESPWQDRGDFIDRKIEEAIEKPPPKRKR